MWVISMNKKTNSKLLLKCLNAVDEVGLSCKFTVSILFGDPAETPQTAAKSIKYVRGNYRRYRFIGTSFILLFPGSKLYSDAVSSGIIEEKQFFENTDFNPPVINLTNFTRSQFLAFQYLISYERIVCSNSNVKCEFSGGHY
jgi:hypothetical protein